MPSNPCVTDALEHETYKYAAGRDMFEVMVAVKRVIVSCVSLSRDTARAAHCDIFLRHFLPNKTTKYISCTHLMLGQLMPRVQNQIQPIVMVHLRRFDADKDIA